MIVSDSKRFVCFRPWKAASSTLAARLRPYESGKYPAPPQEYPGFEGKMSKHDWTIEMFLKLPESDFGYFSFVFVRNPYDRLYSGFLQRTERIGQLVSTNGGKLGPEAKLEADALEQGFEGFIEFMVKRFERQGAILGYRLSDFVMHEGQRWVDYLGYVETFDTSLDEVLDKMGIDNSTNPKATKNVNVRADQTDLSASERSKSRYRYLDKHSPKTIQLINELYRSDLEPLGFKTIEANELSALQEAQTPPCPFLNV